MGSCDEAAKSSRQSAPPGTLRGVAVAGARAIHPGRDGLLRGIEQSARFWQRASNPATGLIAARNVARGFHRSCPPLHAAVLGYCTEGPGSPSSSFTTVV